MWTPGEEDQKPEERPDRRAEMGLPTLGQFAQLMDPCVRHNLAWLAKKEEEAADRCYDRASEILAAGGPADRARYESVWGDMIAAGALR